MKAWWRVSQSVACRSGRVKGFRHSSTAVQKSKNIASLLQRSTDSEAATSAEIEVDGFVRTIRKQKRVAFAAVSDGSSLQPVQAVLKPDQAELCVLPIGIYEYLLILKPQTINWSCSATSRRMAEMPPREAAVTRVKGVFSRNIRRERCDGIFHSQDLYNLMLTIHEDVPHSEEVSKPRIPQDNSPPTGTTST